MEQAKEFQGIEEDRINTDIDRHSQARSSNISVKSAPFSSSVKQGDTETKLLQQCVEQLEQVVKGPLQSEKIDEDNSEQKLDFTAVKLEKDTENANSGKETDSICDREIEIKDNVWLASACQRAENESAGQQQDWKRQIAFPLPLQQKYNTSETVSNTEVEKVEEAFLEPIRQQSEEKPLSENWLKNEAECQTMGLNMESLQGKDIWDGEAISSCVVSEQKETVGTICERDGATLALAASMDKYNQKEEQAGIAGEGIENTTADLWMITTGDNQDGDEAVDVEVKAYGGGRGLKRFLSQTELYLVKSDQQADQLDDTSHLADLNPVTCGDVAIPNVIPQSDQYTLASTTDLNSEAGEAKQTEPENGDKCMAERPRESADDSQSAAQDGSPDGKSNSSISWARSQIDNGSNRAAIAEQVSQSNQTSKDDFYSDFSQAEESRPGSSGLVESASCRELDRGNSQEQADTSCHVDWVQASDLEQVVCPGNQSQFDQNGKGNSAQQFLKSVCGSALDQVAPGMQHVNTSATLCSDRTTDKLLSPSHTTDSSGRDKPLQQADQLAESDQTAERVQSKKPSFSDGTEDGHPHLATHSKNDLVHHQQPSKANQAPEEGHSREESELCKTAPSVPVDGSDQTDDGGLPSQNVGTEIECGKGLKGKLAGVPEKGSVPVDLTDMKIGQGTEHVRQPPDAGSHTGIKTTANAAASNRLPGPLVVKDQEVPAKMLTNKADQMTEPKPDSEELVNVSDIKKAFEKKDQKKKAPEAKKKSGNLFF